MEPFNLTARKQVKLGHQTDPEKFYCFPAIVESSFLYLSLFLSLFIDCSPLDTSKGFTFHYYFILCVKIVVFICGHHVVALIKSDGFEVSVYEQWIFALFMIPTHSNSVAHCCFSEPRNWINTTLCEIISFHFMK